MVEKGYTDVEPVPFDAALFKKGCMAAFYWEEGGDPDSEASLRSVYWEVGTITQVNWRQGCRNTEVQKVGIKYKGEHEEVWHSCASEDYNTIWTFIKLVEPPPAAGAPPPAPAAGPLGAASSARPKRYLKGRTLRSPYAAGAEPAEADTEVDNNSESDDNVPVLLRRSTAAKRACRKVSDYALLGMSSEDD